MDIMQIIEAAPTTCNNWVQRMTSGKMEAILNFSTRKAAITVADQLLEAGAAEVSLQPTPYNEISLLVKW